MPNVVIGEVEYEVYRAVADADSFLLADMQLHSVWSAAIADTRARGLVTATRWLDQQKWQGSKTSSGQTLDWPRTGVIVEGSEVDSNTIPQDILDGCVVLAAKLIQDSAIIESSSTGSNLRRVKAGSAEVEFFRPTSGAVFPDVVQRYIAPYLAGSVTFKYNFGAVSWGTDERTGVPTKNSFLRTSGVG